MSVARWLVGGAALIVAAGLVVGAKRFARALDVVERAQITLAEAEANASIIRAARRETPWVGVSVPVEPDLSPRVLEALGKVGIDREHLKSVRQTRDAGVAAGASGSVRRRTVSVSIESMTIAEIAAFLDHWEHQAAEWTIARAEIQRNAAADGAGTLRLEFVRTYASDSVIGRTVARAKGG